MYGIVSRIRKRLVSFNGAGRQHLPVVVVVLVTFLVFLPTLGNEFINWDDDLNVYRNPHLEQITPKNLAYFWTHSYGNLYIPLTYMSYALDTLLWHGHVMGYHVTNILLHVLSAVAVFGILRLLFREPWACALGALVFAIHPAQAEPVAWVTGRKDVFAGFLCLFAMYEYLVWRRRGSRARYALAMVVFLAALLAKPTALVAPLMLLVAELFIERRNFEKTVLALVPWMVLSAAWAGIVISMQGEGAGGLSNLNMSDRMVVASNSLLFYIRHVFVPMSLSPVYARSISSVLYAGWTCFAPLIVFAIGIAMLRASRHYQAAAAIFVAGLCPVLGIVPFSYQRIATVADRYLYLPLLGAGIAATLLLASMGNSRSLRRWVVAVAAFILVLFAAMTWAQGRVWRTPLTLWKRAVRVSPGCFAVRANIGAAYAMMELYQQAIAEFQHAGSLRKRQAPLEYNLGNALLRIGATEEALKHYRTAVRYAEKDAQTHFHLGSGLAAAGSIDEAIAEYRIGLELDPSYAEAHSEFSLLLEKKGEPDEALRHVNEAIRLKPRMPGAHLNRGYLLIKKGDKEGAIQAFRTAINLNPRWAEARCNLGEALMNLGRWVEARQILRDGLKLSPFHLAIMSKLAWLLATCPSDEIRDGKEAVRLAEAACNLSGRRHVRALDALAAAHAEVARYRDAAQVAAEAARLATEQGSKDLSAEIEARRTLYEAGKPYRVSEGSVNDK